METVVPDSRRSSTCVDSSKKRSGPSSTPHIARMGSTRAANNTGTETKKRIQRRKDEASDTKDHLLCEKVAEVPRLAQPWSRRAKQQSRALTDTIRSELEAHIFECDDGHRRTNSELVQLLASAMRNQNEQDLLKIINQWTRYGTGDSGYSTEPEKVLYPMFSALVVYVMIHLHKHHNEHQSAGILTRSKTKNPASTASASASNIERLLLPPATSDFKPAGFDEDFKIDSALVSHLPGHDIELQANLDCRDILAIVEFKQMASMLDDALKQIILYNRNIYSSQHNCRFVWALTICSTQVRACLLLHDAVLVSETMDIAISDGRKQLIELLVNWSMCDQSQLGYDPTIQYNADIEKWIIDSFDDATDSVNHAK
ncbi:hypothetical protein H4R20_002428 [Coemansia guatemalensis]|uniref:Fungal-type protein kinase domain-containing protein n=1 Tax=Coemansia guatemalensis TaxID=2761395 RepID=A0A9W8I1G9_9FUNG|nr:hypothetical protein H4R20_002428 [Coemansia guatemalensis]